MELMELDEILMNLSDYELGGLLQIHTSVLESYQKEELEKKEGITGIEKFYDWTVVVLIRECERRGLAPERLSDDNLQAARVVLAWTRATGKA